MELNMGEAESRFADMIWEKEPVTSHQLVQDAEKVFCWKRTTTHTVIKRLCDKGLFVNNKGMIKALVTREEFYSLKSRDVVQRSYSGSLPAFINAFVSNKELTEKEIKEIKEIIRKIE